MISSSGRTRLPLAMRWLTSAAGTARTSAGNWSATASHVTCTAPSVSWGTTTDCGTSRTRLVASRAPTCASGRRKTAGGSCPITRSKGMRMTASVGTFAATAGGPAAAGGGTLAATTSGISTSGITTGDTAASGSATSSGAGSGGVTSGSTMSGRAMLA